MKVTVVRPGDLGESEARLWAEFQKRSPIAASPLLSLTFAQAVDRVRRNARVAVVEEQGKIKAFFPYELTPNNVARAIGWRVSGLQGLISSGAPLDARLLVKMAGLRGWRFDHADATEPALAHYHYRGAKMQVPVIDLGSGWDSYINTRTNQFRRENRRRRRHLESDVGTISLEWHVSRLDYLPLLIKWKSEQYDSARYLYSDPAARLIIEELITTTNEDCHGGLSVLFAGDQPIAVHFGMMGPRFLCSIETAYDPNFARAAPGLTLWLALAEQAAGHGIAWIDLGYGMPSRNGRPSYKLDLANYSYAVIGGAVWVSRAEAAVRAFYRRLLYDRQGHQRDQ